MHRATERFSGGVETSHLYPGTGNGRNLRLVGDTKDAEAMLQQTRLQGIDPQHKRLSRLDSMDDLVAPIGLSNTRDALVSHDFDNSSGRARFHTHAPAQWSFKWNHHGSDMHVRYLHRQCSFRYVSRCQIGIRMPLTSPGLHRAPAELPVYLPPCELSRGTSVHQEESRSHADAIPALVHRSKPHYMSLQPYNRV